MLSHFDGPNMWWHHLGVHLTVNEGESVVSYWLLIHMWLESHAGQRSLDETFDFLFLSFLLLLLPTSIPSLLSFSSYLLLCCLVPSKPPSLFSRYSTSLFLCSLCALHPCAFLLFFTLPPPPLLSSSVQVRAQGTGCSLAHVWEPWIVLSAGSESPDWLGFSNKLWERRGGALGVKMPHSLLPPPPLSPG